LILDFGFYSITLRSYRLARYGFVIRNAYLANL